MSKEGSRPIEFGPLCHVNCWLYLCSLLRVKWIQIGFIPDYQRVQMHYKNIYIAVYGQINSSVNHVCRLNLYTASKSSCNSTWIMSAEFQEIIYTLHTVSNIILLLVSLDSRFFRIFIAYPISSSLFYLWFCFLPFVPRIRFPFLLFFLHIGILLCFLFSLTDVITAYIRLI